MGKGKGIGDAGENGKGKVWAGLIKMETMLARRAKVRRVRAREARAKRTRRAKRVSGQNGRAIREARENMQGHLA